MIHKWYQWAKGGALKLRADSRPVVGFWEEQVHCRNLDQYPYAIDNVVLPTDAIQCNRVNISVEEDGEPDSQLLNGNTLGTLLVWEDLDLKVFRQSAGRHLLVNVNQGYDV